MLALAVVCAGLFDGCGRAVPPSTPEATPAPSTTASQTSFPLRRSTSQRYLVDQAGRPFLLHGDAAWSLLVKLTKEQADRYLDDRQRRGFNTLLVNLLEHEFAEDPPYNAYGDAPFLRAGDYSYPNERYFAHVDWVLTRAAERGLLILLTPSYLGYEGGQEGWYREMQENGIERLRAYGRYLGVRYRNFTNIVWVHGGDYNPPEHSLVKAIWDGLREANPNALHTFHGARGTAARAFAGEETDWLAVNTIYTDEDSVVAAARSEYTASTLPFFLIEGRYEGEGIDEAGVRAQAYQAVLSGASGQLMGNKHVWAFDQGWERALDSPGARSMTRLYNLLEDLSWWQLRPDFAGLILDGVETGTTQAVSAVSDDRLLAVIYIPSHREVVIDAAFLKGPIAKASWVDPTAEQSFTIPVPVTEGSRPIQLSSPKHNNRGYGDWLLVLESGNR